MTLAVLEDVRTHFDAFITVHSGFRCAHRNAEVHGAADSQHLRGRAVDFEVYGVPNAEVQAYLKEKYPRTYGIGSYRTFTHLDTRSGSAARWSG